MPLNCIPVTTTAAALAVKLDAARPLGRVLGGVIGYFVVEPWADLFPYLLVVAASSFIYVAVADLLPQLQQRLSWRDTLTQVVWLGAGLLVVVLATEGLHGAEH